MQSLLLGDVDGDGDVDIFDIVGHGFESCWFEILEIPGELRRYICSWLKNLEGLKDWTKEIAHWTIWTFI
ncbi:MAG: hypothetical protein JSV05_03650 [Candidatus Bathyarchaeota archaeon]|nr:MAG: hypothetical protein JSV05_03650 [Candidatus Bathyarchaeota archaeon]